MASEYWVFRCPFTTATRKIHPRFYVRREYQGQWRRGVVFIKQIIPYYLVALAARRVYHEQFVAMPMQHSVEASDSRETLGQVSYQWRYHGIWGRMAVRSLGSMERANAGSVEEFVAEHYWGYNSQPNGSTLEYLVDRPQWRIRKAAGSTLECDVERLYGDEFAGSLSGSPISAFWAEGSAVTLHRGVLLQ